MGLFKKIFGGMKDRMKAVDNLTQSINNGDVSIKVFSDEKCDSDVKSEKTGAFKGFKDRMNAVDSLTKNINNSKKG